MSLHLLHIYTTSDKIDSVKVLRLDQIKNNVFSNKRNENKENEHESRVEKNKIKIIEKTKQHQKQPNSLHIILQPLD